VVMSVADIEGRRRACGATDAAFERTFADVRPGMTEREIAQRMKVFMLEAGADRPGWIMMTSGHGQYDRTFGTPRERPLGHGEMLWIDAAAVVNGYWSDFDRAGILGGPSEEQERLQEDVHEATMAGVRAVRAGIEVSAVAEAANVELERRGLAPVRSRRMGHGLGLTSTEPPDVDVRDATVLAAGMVITVEPAVTRADGLFQVEQNVVVRDDGYELLSTAPPELRRLG